MNTYRMRKMGLWAVLAALALSVGAAQAAPIAVKPATVAALKQAVASQKGHVVVLNFWATWCDQCVAEFPAIVHVNNEFHKQGLVTLTVSADHAKDVPTKVQPFLKKQRASFPQFLQTPDDVDTYTSAFDPRWDPAAYPRTYIYDRQGRLVKVFDGALTLKSLTAAVKPLLKT